MKNISLISQNVQINATLIIRCLLKVNFFKIFVWGSVKYNIICIIKKNRSLLISSYSDFEYLSFPHPYFFTGEFSVNLMLDIYYFVTVLTVYSFFFP